MITQENHYSPFGLSLQGVDFQPATPDYFKFSQNEQQSDFGLNLYDFGARKSDPTIGNRFWQMDPLAEIARRFSPYIYANANPLRFVDPDGLSIQQIQDFEGNRDMMSIYKAPKGK
ncbi:RHS repeat domain-containing protein [Runella sp.]|uniref:RHS repeat domain-containing protein n=1 Tax=Runella sp. TaxID=1960881 RepID=UPI003D0D1691